MGRLGGEEARQAGSDLGRPVAGLARWALLGRHTRATRAAGWVERLLRSTPTREAAAEEGAPAAGGSSEAKDRRGWPDPGGAGLDLTGA